MQILNSMENDIPHLSSGVQETSTKHEHEGGLSSQALNLMAEHPYITAAAAGTAFLVGARFGIVGLIASGEAATEPVVASAAIRPANIFSLLMKSEAELASIASSISGEGKPLFTLADTTMSVRNPEKWKLLLDAGGRDPYNAEVLKLANRWGTLAEEKMAHGEPITRNSLELLSVPQIGDPPVSFGSVKQTFLTHWKFAGQI